MGRLSGRKRKVGVMIIILADDHRKGNFHNLIEKTTDGLFSLMNLTTNSSDAKLYVVTSLMQGNTSDVQLLVVVRCPATVVPYKVGQQAHSRLEVYQPVSSVWKTPSLLHSLCNIPSPSPIQLRVECEMMIYAYTKTSAWNIYTSNASTVRV